MLAASSFFFCRKRVSGGIEHADGAIAGITSAQHFGGEALLVDRPACRSGNIIRYYRF